MPSSFPDGGTEVAFTVSIEALRDSAMSLRVVMRGNSDDIAGENVSVLTLLRHEVAILLPDAPEILARHALYLHLRYSLLSCEEPFGPWMFASSISVPSFPEH